ncbi:MAG TPA: sulfite exporter TauE/SafE family protein, partial [Thermoanaerobaculia bacterium]
ALYGGYFGAGMGILMLAALGLIGLTDMHQMNGLKNVLAVCINGVAAIYFVFAQSVVWSDVVTMMLGTIVGGFVGAKLARKLGRKFVRRFVVCIGFGMALLLWIRGL